MLSCAAELQYEHITRILECAKHAVLLFLQALASNIPVLFKLTLTVTEMAE